MSVVQGREKWKTFIKAASYIANWCNKKIIFAHFDYLSWQYKLLLLQRFMNTKKVLSNNEYGYHFCSGACFSPEVDEKVELRLFVGVGREEEEERLSSGRWRLGLEVNCKRTNEERAYLV